MAPTGHRPRARRCNVPRSGSTRRAGGPWFKVAAALLWGHTSACTWGQFDEFEEQAPVVVLEASKGVKSGFGQSLSSGTHGKVVTLLVGGTAGVSQAATFSIGHGQSPGGDALQGGFCDTSSTRISTCTLADSTAYARIPNADGDPDMCFAYGWGEVIDRSRGIMVRCADGTDESLGAPRRARDDYDDDFERTSDHQPLWLASDRREVPLLLAGVPKQRAAWFYPPGERTPVSLSLPGGASVPESFGGAVAVAALADEARLLAVAAPELGQVYLFTSDDGTTAKAVGCLGGYEGFARTLAAGDVDGDGVDDLVIADDALVTVFSGAALATLPEAFTSACSLGALPADSIVVSFGCGTRETVEGCADGFAASVAVGDLDGDGDGEVLVGSPGLTVHGVERAGAVLVYDAEGDSPHALSDLLYLSSAEDGDRLGTSVVAIHQNDHDLVAAGAPGGSKAALFYCSDLMRDRDRTGRCQ